MLENMKGKRGLPLVEVEGKPFDMGEMSGRKCASRAKSYRASMAESIEYSTGVGWGKAVERAKAFLPYAEGFYPDFVEEIRGYASGAKMPFEDAFTMCCHELLSPLGFRGCTDMAFSGEATRDGNVPHRPQRGLVLGSAGHRGPAPREAQGQARVRDDGLCRTPPILGHELRGHQPDG